MNLFLSFAILLLLSVSGTESLAEVLFKGVNLAGPEFGTVAAHGGALPGKFGIHYQYPNQDEVNYFKGAGMNIVRLCFRWERLQPATNTDFSVDEFRRLHAFVTGTTGKGVYVILNVHNFARYYPDIGTFAAMESGPVGIIGSRSVANSAFADFWTRVAAIYKTNSLVIFGLMNEPNALPSAQWVSAANDAISAIRSTGATNLILVPGISWSSAFTWNVSGNSVSMLKIRDPGGNYAYEVHQYLDWDSSGRSTNIVNALVGVKRISGFTEWLRTNNRKGFLGEFAAANSMVGTNSWQIGDEALTNMLRHIENNSEVWLGWTWWAAGPIWGDYMFSIEPTTSGVDRPAMAVLKKFLSAAPTQDGFR